MVFPSYPLTEGAGTDDEAHEYMEEILKRFRALEGTREFNDLPLYQNQGVQAVPTIRERVDDDGNIKLSFKVKNALWTDRVTEAHLVLASLFNNTDIANDKNTKNSIAIRYCFNNKRCRKLRNIRKARFEGENVYKIHDVTRAFRKSFNRLCYTKCVVNFIIPGNDGNFTTLTTTNKSGTGNILVLFKNTGRALQTLVSSPSSEIIASHGVTSRRRRSYDDMENNVENEDDDDSGPCRLRRWYVRYADAGIDNFGDGLYAGYCAGTCELSDNHTDFTNHAILKSRYLANNTLTKKHKVPPARCVPSHYSSIKVIGTTESGDLVARLVRNMIVDTCMCL